VQFKDDEHLMRVIERIVSSVGRRIDESSPMVDARLQDGSRVNAIIPPLSIDGPVVSIRRFGSDPLKMSMLIEYNALTKDIADMLQMVVTARLNILISVVPAPAKPRCSTRSRHSFPKTNASSPSKTRPNFSYSSRTSSDSKPGRRTSKVGRSYPARSR
jgi:hypothetical protein